MVGSKEDGMNILALSDEDLLKLELSTLPGKAQLPELDEEDLQTRKAYGTTTRKLKARLASQDQ